MGRVVRGERGNGPASFEFFYGWAPRGAAQLSRACRSMTAHRPSRKRPSAGSHRRGPVPGPPEFESCLRDVAQPVEATSGTAVFLGYRARSGACDRPGTDDATQRAAQKPLVKRWDTTLRAGGHHPPSLRVGRHFHGGLLEGSAVCSRHRRGKIRCGARSLPALADPASSGPQDAPMGNFGCRPVRVVRSAGRPNLRKDIIVRADPHQSMPAHPSRLRLRR